MKKYKLEYIPVERIIPYPNNPRINDHAVDQVADSIQNFGFKNPLILDEDFVIINGHTRLKAAKKLEMKEVPCIIATDLTNEQIKAFRLVDNKVSEIAEWNTELLEEELRAIKGIDMTAFGFEITTISDVQEDEYEITQDDDYVPKSKLGEVYQLGNHRLMCGDCTSENNVKKLTGGGTNIDLLLTDPPYNVDYTGGTGMKIQNDNMSSTKFKEFLCSAFSTAAKVMKPGGAFYVWHSSTEAHNFIEALLRSGLSVKQQLIWIKNGAVLSRQDYNWRHEPCLYGWKEGAAHYFIEDFTKTTTWEEDSINLSRASKEELKEYVEELRDRLTKWTDILYADKPSKNDMHPTSKPVRLMAELISNSTKQDGVVLDIFGGSGSTLIAAEQLGRRCYCMELDPKYVDVIIDRWEQCTGDKAIKL